MDTHGASAENLTPPTVELESLDKYFTDPQAPKAPHWKTGTARGPADYNTDGVRPEGSNGVQLKYINHTHEAVLMWLFQNPEKNQYECATALGYTSSYISSLIHTDLFQLRIAEMREKNHQVGIYSLTEQMAGVAAQALQKLGDRLAVENDIEKVRSVADTVLKRLGYGIAKTAVVVNAPGGTVNIADKQTLLEARSIMSRVKALTTPLTRTDDADEPGSRIINGESREIEGEVLDDPLAT